jgi:hypothetical protein
MGGVGRLPRFSTDAPPAVLEENVIDSVRGNVHPPGADASGEPVVED